MSEIVSRLKEYIDYKKLTVTRFERSVGMSYNSFGRSLKNGGAIGTDKLEKICENFQDINPVWLVTGKGDMLLSSQDSSVSLSQSKVETSPDLLQRFEAIIAENTLLKKEVENLTSELAKLKGE